MTQQKQIEKLLLELYKKGVKLESCNIKDYDEKILQILNTPTVSNRAFEYRIIDHDMFYNNDNELIKSMGLKGWEIIKIFEPMKYLNSDAMFVRIYYKREIKP